MKNFLSLKRFFKINKTPLFFSLRKRTNQNSKYILKIANLLFYIWLILLAIKIYIFGGMPILSRLFGDGAINYLNFYFPTLGGCEQIIRILGNSLYVVYFINLDKKFKNFFNFHFLSFLFFLSSPLLIELSRGNQIFLMLTIFAVIISFLKFKTKNELVKFLCFFIFSILISVIILGFFGLTRFQASYEETTNMILNIDSNSPIIRSILQTKFAYLFIKIIWYFTAPILNINLQMQSYPNFNFSPDVLSSIFPTVIRSYFFNNDYGDLVMGEFFNTSGFLQSFFRSFGIAGSIPMVLIIQILSIYAYFKSWAGDLRYRLSYPILFSANFLSFFSNYFFILIVIVYPFVIFFVEKKIQSELFYLKEKDNLFKN